MEKYCDLHTHSVFSDGTYTPAELIDAAIDAGLSALALTDHKKELFECDDQERIDYAEDLALASKAVKKLWGCTKLNMGSYGDTNPHLHFNIVPKYEGGFEFGGAFAITNPDPVFLKDEEYQEMIDALKKELNI